MEGLVRNPCHCGLPRMGGLANGKLRTGVPMEVMGLMLGEFVDDYTVRVVDVCTYPAIISFIACKANSTDE